MSRVLHRVFCDRPSKAHTLARTTVDQDGLAVDVTEILVTGSGMAPIKRTYRLADLGDLDGLTINVTCPCGTHYMLRISELLRGQSTNALRIPPESETGVSYDRRRPGIS